MLPLRVRASLIAVQAVGVATLLRSIAFDRWITVVASLVLIGSAMAVQRGRTWGIGLTFAAAVWFPVAAVIGIAPPWFCLVGLVSALPFAFTLRPLARFDKHATALLALLTSAAGAAVAFGWKEIAWSLFRAIPSLRPSGHPQHGLAVLAALAVVVTAIATRTKQAGDSEGARVRVGERVRVSESENALLAESLDEARLHEDEPADLAHEQRRRVL